MLSKRDQKLLIKELAKAKKINQRIQGQMLPEEKALFEKEYPSGGEHIHDDSNPFGMHRHFLGDKINGAHTHSPQNPGGEHVHGEFEGKALITGRHYHKEHARGYHHHRSDEKENSGTLVPQKPDGIL